MAQRLLYNSIQKATPSQPAIAKVDLEKDGAIIELGTVENDKGSNEFVAKLLDGTMLGDIYNTKKQAGGALKKHFDAGLPMPDTKGEVLKKAAEKAGKKVKETKLEKAKVLEYKGTPRPSALAIKSEPLPPAGFPADWNPPRLPDGSIDFSYNEDDPLEIPPWLRRTPKKKDKKAA